MREKADTHLYGQVSAMVSAPEPPSGMRTVAIGGCIAQRDGERLREHVPNVDVVFGTRALSSLPDLIERSRGGHGGVAADISEDSPGFSTDLPSRRAERWHAWVPIMTGCNNFCSYCIVPYVRGRERSRAFEDVESEVNSYGRDRYGEPRFAELLRAVGASGVDRVRFTSSHPKDLSDDTISAMAETPAVMPHLHLAVQSGSTRVLRAMNRHYSSDDYLALVGRLRDAIPGIALSTDLIVGFPGETEEDFRLTLDLVREAEFSSRTASTVLRSLSPPRRTTPISTSSAGASRCSWRVRRSATPPCSWDTAQRTRPCTSRCPRACRPPISWARSSTWTSTRRGPGT